MPASAPATIPHTRSGLPPARKKARFTAATSDSTNEPPKILPVPPFFRSASVKPLADIHGRANSSGEYQTPPTRKVESAATSAPSQLTFAGSMRWSVGMSAGALDEVVTETGLSPSERRPARSEPAPPEPAPIDDRLLR